MPSAGVVGSLNKGPFLYAGSTLNNPEKLVVISRAERVGVLENGWVLPIVGGAGGFSLEVKVYERD